MNLLFDLHTHTIASGHAYSTLKENMEVAYERGLKAYGFSEHAEAVPGTVKNIYFLNLRVVPREYKGMLIYAGVEANIMDYKGSLDIDEVVCKKVDYVIASLHTICIKPGTVDENMSAYIGAMQNPYVKIIGHPDDARYPIDYEELVKQAIKHEVVLEMNNSSLHPKSSRQGGLENVRTMLRTCKKYGCPIICNTDSHYADYVGEFSDSQKLLEEECFPEDLVLNTDLDNLSKILINR